MKRLLAATALGAAALAPIVSASPSDASTAHAGGPVTARASGWHTAARRCQGDLCAIVVRRGSDLRAVGRAEWPTGDEDHRVNVYRVFLQTRRCAHTRISTVSTKRSPRYINIHFDQDQTAIVTKRSRWQYRSEAVIRIVNRHTGKYDTVVIPSGWVGLC